MNSKFKSLYCYLVLIILYAVGSLTLPPPKGELKKYNISLLHLRLIDLSIVIPFAAIWLCAVFGFYKINIYSKLIKRNKDGKAVAKITTGIGLLAFWLPITSTISVYANYLILRHPGLTSVNAIIENYLTLLLPLLGFIFICIGTNQLSKLAKHVPSLRATNFLAIFMILIGVVYVHLVSTTHNRLNSTYHLPIFFILVTVVAPYIFMWFLGIHSFYEIHAYRLKVAGIVYRSSWKLLSFGIGSIIIVSILIQYLTTISQRFNKLSLNWVLLIIYMLLVLLAVGYVFIALGVNKLKKIEEV